MDPSESNRAVAKKLVSIFGGKPTVVEFWDQADKTSVAVLMCSGAPQAHVNSYATVNLANHPLNAGRPGLDLRVELVGACGDDFESFENILSTCAFNIINDNFEIAPGEIFRGVVSMYVPESDMAHVMFVTPFVWDEDLSPVTNDLGTVAFLQAVPISEGEARYASEHGSEALEDLFEERQIDVYDIHRKSVA